ncbi:MAG: transcriptional repressor NrdR [Chloroflexi bacterium]|jgi:transcriptional repressor NrdR|nr:MAG: transcriptional repressor NrdR [Chloroflexota bacterium]
MFCIQCGKDRTKVVDSRETRAGVRRRRECLSCGTRFTTLEKVQNRTLVVIKQDNRRDDFQRAKLTASLTKACVKRPLPINAINKLIDDIENKLTESGKQEIRSEQIGELVMTRLKKLDRVAYIRYASVYRDFSDIEKFKEEIEALLLPDETNKVTNAQLSFLGEANEPSLRPRRGRPAKL